MSIAIETYTADRLDEVLDLSLRAWDPVFAQLKQAAPAYVYQSFYPQRWRTRQLHDINSFLETDGGRTWVAVDEGSVVGWVGIRLHSVDSMGEIYILAVDPLQQRRGIATALMDHAMAAMRTASIRIVMVETGGDPGHKASRATYEQAGFERWPVARYFREL
jgi:GNAT superfamily N-acetyltransferase